MTRYRKRIRAIFALLVCVLAFPIAAEAQRGSKFLKQANIDAVKKTGQAAVLTDKEVQQLSLQSVQWMDAKNPTAKDGDVYAERLKKLVAGLENEDGLTLNFEVYLVAEVNAFATPDGSVRVLAGLMNLMTDDEMRAVIGHEIGHVKRKHSKKQYQKAYAVSAGRDAAEANTGSASVLAEGEIGQFVEEVLNAKFSRNDESEADEYGFQFMLKHGYDYHAMETAFLKLGALTGDQANDSLKATHPDPNERAQEAKRWAEAEDKKRPAKEATPAETQAAPEAAPEDGAGKAPEQAPEEAAE